MQSPWRSWLSFWIFLNLYSSGIFACLRRSTPSTWSDSKWRGTSMYLSCMMQSNLHWTALQGELGWKEVKKQRQEKESLWQSTKIPFWWDGAKVGVFWPFLLGSVGQEGRSTNKCFEYWSIHTAAVVCWDCRPTIRVVNSGWLWLSVGCFFSLFGLDYTKSSTRGAVTVVPRSVCLWPYQSRCVLMPPVIRAFDVTGE